MKRQTTIQHHDARRCRCTPEEIAKAVSLLPPGSMPEQRAKLPSRVHAHTVARATVASEAIHYACEIADAHRGLILAASLALIVLALRIIFHVPHVD